MGHAAVQGVLTIVTAMTLVLSARPDRRPASPTPIVAVAPGAETSPRRPEPPRQSIDLTVAPTTGATIDVPAGGDLQAAIDAARLGDRIVLAAGATYRGPFKLKPKDGSGWIVITSNIDHTFPRAGARVGPDSARLMAKLTAARGPIIDAEPRAHHYRLVALDIAPADGVVLRSLVQFGAEETDAEALPHHLIVDRCYIHGDPRRGARRGVALNARDAAVIGSHVSDFKEVGADSQAIAGWNGPGPFVIANNYLEAAGENVMFGGADPSIRNLVPADIEILGNHFTKPLRWKVGDRAFEGSEWAVKNLFELKNAKRVRIAGNVFEYNWPHAQNGFAILFTVRNQDGGSPWSVVEDVIFENNLVRHVGAGINVLGHDDIHSSQATSRIQIRNNLFTDVGGAWGSGRLFQLLDGTSDIGITHNTALQSDTLVAGGDRAPHARFAFEDNIALHNRYGIIGSGTGPGRPTIDRYFPGASIRRNVFIGGTPENLPSDNFFAGSLDRVGFVDPHARNFRLTADSRYRSAATDGRDIGADIAAIEAMTDLALQTTSSVRSLSQR